VIVKPYWLGCLSHASYLVADENNLVAAVVDPQRDVEAYLEEAEAVGLRIEHVLLTHFHADFVSGHLELAARTGATIHVGAAGATDYPSRPAREGDAIDVGDVRLRVLETPGHTPESVCYVVYDRADDPERPHAVLTGDTLFVGDVGRPDLAASPGASVHDLAGLLYDSLSGALATLPDETLVYPAHGAGSLCGRNLSSDTVSTLGRERRTNPALRAASRDEFVRLVTADLPETPAYFAFDADLNRRVHEDLEAVVARALVPLPLEEVLARRAAGATVLDARPAEAFAAGHLAGSVNVGLSGRYATWAGALLDRTRPIVLVAEPGREQEAATRLGRIGFDRVAGRLDGGAAAFLGRDDLLARLRRETPAGLATRLTGRDPPLVVDVRAPAEWEASRVRGSVNLPLLRYERWRDDLRARAREREVVVLCRTGHRSSLAVSLLQRDGVQAGRVADLAGGWVALEADAAAAASTREA
jgi:glyoxylase-like metal-dependent hydrolase (beta-lactamase superfamily II)/rhodanese-related sulfurtransferase